MNQKDTDPPELRPLDRRLSELLGGDFRQQTVDQILATTSRVYPREDVSYRDLFWIYEHLLTTQDSENTRKQVAAQLNEKHTNPETRIKTESTVRLLSEGNPAYEEISVTKIYVHLNKDLQALAAIQRHHSDTRARNAADVMGYSLRDEGLDIDLIRKNLEQQNTRGPKKIH
ncbi:Uncharacterised protein [uncultured archaeon]|nr:Uncharacterised protein [uncultured archaeon]